jgi:uncharacterized membrane protein YphA (DoxX/SURF4 family)
MKIASIVIRVLVGLLYAFASIAFFLKLVEAPEVTGSVKVFNDGMAASVYLMPTVKIIELLCAVAFLSGRLVPLATVVIFPITLNIFLFHAFLEPSGLAIAALLLIGNLFLAYYHRKKYKGLLTLK